MKYKQKESKSWWGRWYSCVETLRNSTYWKPPSKNSKTWLGWAREQQSLRTLGRTLGSSRRWRHPFQRRGKSFFMSLKTYVGTNASFALHCHHLILQQLCAVSG